MHQKKGGAKKKQIKGKVMDSKESRKDKPLGKEEETCWHFVTDALTSRI